ncbi:MAG: trypsin-like serine protease, partial [Fidelibacterota bacterium]
MNHFSISTLIMSVIISSFGYAGISNRIIGGEIVPDSTYYPWMIAIVDADSTAADGLMCGGVLVSPTLVLTAGHCVNNVIYTTDSLLGSVNIIAGTVDLNNTEHAEIISVDSTFNFPGYRAGWLLGNTFHGGDIGFLSLADSVENINSFLSIIESEENLSPGDSVTVIGWSYTYPDTISDVLQHVKFPVQPLDTCKAHFGQPEYLYEEVHICAGNSDGDGPCTGDSGGPLVFEHEGEYVLGGIISFGTNPYCLSENFHGIYVNVFEFRGWINGIINGNSFNNNLIFSNRDNSNNLLSGTLRADSFHPFIASGDTLPLPLGASVTVKTNSQFLENDSLQHHRWGSDASEFRLIHDFTVPAFPIEKTAKFVVLDSVIIISDYEAEIQIRDPWFVENDEQNNEFKILADSTYQLFLNQRGPQYSEMFYALKAEESVGSGAYPFDKWQAYNSTGLVDTTSEWAYLSSPNNHDSCMVIFKQEHVIVKALYDGPPAEPDNFVLDCSGDFPMLSWSPNVEDDFSNYRVYYRYCCNPRWTDWFYTSTTDTTWTDDNFDMGNGFNDVQFK